MRASKLPKWESIRAKRALYAVHCFEQPPKLLTLGWLAGAFGFNSDYVSLIPWNG